MRKVGTESRKSHAEKQLNGFFNRYMSGRGIDLGYAGYEDGVVPILDTATGVDTDYPGYDGRVLPFESESQDYVYSSHMLEHVEDSQFTIREMMRVTKTGGYVIIVVPHHYLYERKLSMPSRYNGDHKRFYTPSVLLSEVEQALRPNSYRVRELRDNDRGYNYKSTPPTHASGCYEIELVLEKIETPDWRLE